MTVKMDSLIAGRYQIINTLGKGGFGETFLAKDTHLPSQRLIVIKRLRQVNSNHRVSAEVITDLFKKEAQVLEELGQNCPQIPTLYAYFVENEQFYLVQEYIEGTSLSDFGIINSAQCRTILTSLLQTLQFIHSQKIIHRDIKPENIIIRHSDGLPILIDFGAVKETMGTVALSSGSLVSSVVVGTKGFMPPEQSTGRTVYSSDLYALALTMIYSLTGKYPIEFPSNSLNGELEWTNFVSDIDPQLQEVLSKASKIDLSQRYSTAKEMLQDLCLSEMQTVAVIPQKREIPEKTPNLQNISPSEVNSPTLTIPVNHNGVKKKSTPPQPMVYPEIKESASNYPQESFTSPQVTPPSRYSGNTPSNSNSSTTPASGYSGNTPSHRQVTTAKTYPQPVSPAVSQPSYSSNHSYIQDNQQKNGWFPLVLSAVIAGVLVAAGFLITEYIQQTQAQLAQIEQEKAETEARLAQEQKMREEEARRREEAERQRQQAELEKARIEELRRQVEAEARNNSNNQTPNVVTNNEETVTPDTGEANSADNPDNSTNNNNNNDSSENVNSLSADSAVNTLVDYYNSISEKNFDRARQINPNSFDPNFFHQFSQVTVENLQVISDNGNSITLEGENTYIYQDGTKQRERRNFTVEMIDGKPKITNSNFLGVIEKRK